MSNRKLILGVTLIVLLFSLTGCLPQSTGIIVPKADVTINEATDINLKILDLTKITRTETDEILGYPLKQIEGAKLIEYRYPEKPLIVKVAKFEDEEPAQDFWGNWIEYINTEKRVLELTQSESDENFLEIRTSNKQILTWQKDHWIVYVEVPNDLQNSVELSYRVKDIIMIHFQNL